MGETIAVTQEKAKEWKADCSWRFPPRGWALGHVLQDSKRAQLRELQEQRGSRAEQNHHGAAPFTPFLIFRV